MTDCTNPAGLHGYRSALLYFDADGQACYNSDGLLVLRRHAGGHCTLIEASGSYRAVAPRYPDLTVTHWPSRLVAPGFIDVHTHFPQVDIIGAPADGLLQWLEQYTFKAECRFADRNHADQVATFFLDELQRTGVTSAMVYATAHPASAHALFEQALARGLRLITGKVLQDRHSPQGLRDQSAEQSLLESEALIQQWHGRQRLGYAITPRFAPTSSSAQLHGAGELAALYPDTWIQSHLAENLAELQWVRQLHPEAHSYLDVYARAGLLRERAVYGHCIHLDDSDRVQMRATGSAAAVCPTSNLFLGSGFFDFGAAQRTGMQWALASDIGGGTSFSPFQTMLAAYYVAREGHTKAGLSLSPGTLWWRHTGAAAQTLGLQDHIGNLRPGLEADFIVLNPRATPLLARRTAAAESLDELLFSFIVSADDRAVEACHIASHGLRRNGSDSTAAAGTA